MPRTPSTLPRRLTQLILGLVMFGFGIGMMLQSGLGVPPWDVLHQGLASRLGMTVGFWSIIVSWIVLLAWIPLRQPPGVGTILNAIVIGLVIDLSVDVLPSPPNLIAAIALLAAGIGLIGVASGLYIGARLGPGPRDGLMTGIAGLGPSIRLTRTVIEVIVLFSGWLLGGTFGPGTVAFAIVIGPIVHITLPLFDVARRTSELVVSR